MATGAVGDVNTAKKLANLFKVDGQYVDGSFDVNLGHWTPRNHGWMSWAFDPLECTGESDILEGYLFLTAIPIPSDGNPVNSIIINVTTAGSGLVSGQCKAALFQDTDGDGDFDLMGTTASQHTAWGTIGPKTMALTSPATVYGRVAYAGIWYRGTTSPKFSSRGVTPDNNLNIVNAGFTRFGADPTGGLTTTAPATITTVNGYNPPLWMALA